MRIIDKIRSLGDDGTFVSFEFFPPKTNEGKANLLARIQRMSKIGPLYVDVTWASGPDETLELTKSIQSFVGIDVMMHVACANITRLAAKKLLDEAFSAGIHNILAIRGDTACSTESANGGNENGFSHTIDFIKFVRETYGPKAFCIAIAGFPEGYPDSKNPDLDMKFLKDKVDAGADMIVTQLFYESELCIDYIRKCRKFGITCPIVPGIMPIQSYRTLMRMASYCHVKIPESLVREIDPIKEDDAAVKKFGIRCGAQMVRDLLKSGLVRGIHFYTLNLARSVSKICSESGLAEKIKTVRQLPWAPCSAQKRPEEGVRPIFWANRPQSYLALTQSWDEFPNGRWGDIRSPAWTTTENIGSHFSSPARKLPPTKRKIAWGDCLVEIADVARVFQRYITNEIEFIPWCQGTLHHETKTIQKQLVEINGKGCFTINSQPRANGVPSEHPIYGWGAKGGIVYQKAYIEFFASPAVLSSLMRRIKTSFPALTYHAVDVRGNSYTNNTVGGVTAVTWGVWPNEEVKQPTVVDPVAFNVWKTEAFQLWLDQWAAIYNEDSPSRALIQSIHDSHFLVNIVDHDFVKGELFRVFEELKSLAESKSSSSSSSKTKESGA